MSDQTWPKDWGECSNDNNPDARYECMSGLDPCKKHTELLADAEGGRASEHDMKQRLQRVLDDYTDAQRAGWSASDYAYAMAAAPGDDDE